MRRPVKTGIGNYEKYKNLILRIVSLLLRTKLKIHRLSSDSREGGMDSSFHLRIVSISMFRELTLVRATYSQFVLLLDGTDQRQTEGRYDYVEHAQTQSYAGQPTRSTLEKP